MRPYLSEHLDKLVTMDEIQHAPQVMIATTWGGDILGI